MFYFKAMFYGVFAYFGFATALLAVPVTFTYTSNAVDLSGLEDWEYQLLDRDIYDWATVLPGQQASLSLEIDCTISGSNISCAELPSDTVIRQSAGATGRTAFAGGPPAVSLKDISGFTEKAVIAREFVIDSSGQVIDWLFDGTEYAQVGDFRVSSDGDSWHYGLSASRTETYCVVRYGELYDFLTNTCRNGAEIPDDLISPMALGTGTWTAQMADGQDLPLTPVPLPTGLPLMAGGMGLLALLRRKSRIL